MNIKPKPKNIRQVILILREFLGMLAENGELAHEYDHDKLIGKFIMKLSDYIHEEPDGT